MGHGLYNGGLRTRIHQEAPAQVDRARAGGSLARSVGGGPTGRAARGADSPVSGPDGRRPKDAVAYAPPEEMRGSGFTGVARRPRACCRRRETGTKPALRTVRDCERTAIRVGWGRTGTQRVLVSDSRP